MDAITYTEARKNLAKTMERVCGDHEAIIVTRRKAESVVLLSLDDFNAIEETFYLIKNPRNAERLARSIKDIETGKAKKKKLIQS